MPIEHPQFARDFGVDHLHFEGIVSFSGADDGDVYWDAVADPDYPGFLAAASALEVRSDSANDSAAEPGAREVTVHGLLADYSYDTEAIAMAGTAQSAGTKEFLRVLKVEVTASGSLDTNDGNITIRAVADTPEVSYIPAGQGVSLDCVGCVPARKTFYLTDFEASINALTTLEMTLFLREVATDTWHAHNPAYAYLGGEQGHHSAPRIPVAVPEKTDMRIFVAVGAASKVSGHIDGYLIDN